MQVIDCQQGTDEWYRARMGIPTASMFAAVMAKRGPRGGLAKTRTTYMHKLAGEICTGEAMESYSNPNMDRGKERESEARDLYAFLREVEPVQVGFILNGNCGCSPDGLVGDDGMVEIKDALPHIQIARLLDGCLPSEHKAQCQGQLLVAERQWVDFISHSRGLPPLIVRVERDEEYIRTIRDDVAQFVAELARLVEWIKVM